MTSIGFIVAVMAEQTVPSPHDRNAAGRSGKGDGDLTVPPAIAIDDASLLRRLQVKGDRRLCVIGLPAGVGDAIDARTPCVDCGEADVVLLFVTDRAMFEDRLPSVLAQIRADAILWLAYVKRSSAKASDLDRDLLRDAVKAYGLTTVGQIAIDVDWSALRLKPIA